MAKVKITRRKRKFKKKIKKLQYSSFVADKTPKFQPGQLIYYRVESRSELVPFTLVNRSMFVINRVQSRGTAKGITFAYGIISFSHSSINLSEQPSVYLSEREVELYVKETEEHLKTKESP